MRWDAIDAIDAMRWVAMSNKLTVVVFFSLKQEQPLLLLKE
jgi:hypothetical protein